MKKMVTVNLLFLATAVFSLSFLIGIAFALWLDRGKDAGMPEEEPEPDEQDHGQPHMVHVRVMRIDPTVLPFVQQVGRVHRVSTVDDPDDILDLYDRLNEAYADLEPFNYDGLAERLINDTNKQWRERH